MGFRVSRLSTLAAFGLALVAACSGSSNTRVGFGGPEDGGGGDGSGKEGGTFGGGGDSSLGGPGPNDGSVGLGDGACAASSTKAQQQPLDMYIMLDQSASMMDPVAGGGDKWSAVTGAINAFLTQPNLTGIAVGIQFFAVPASMSMCPSSCMTNMDCGMFGPCVPIVNTCFGCLFAGGDSCNAPDYAKPAVEIAPLPGVSMPIATAIGMHGPSTNTPTSAALQGAVDHATSWAMAHSGHVVIDVLATDGDPTECDTNLSDIDAIASKGATGNPKILTFVIGVGTSTAALNGIANAGGTMSAFLVDTNANANQQFLDALNKIRGAALGCQYAIPLPEAGMPDYSKVNVQFTPGTGTPQLIPQVQDKAHCPPSGDAWYYDNPSAPTQIVLCDSTCSTVTMDTMGEVDVLIGCQTVVSVH